MRFLKIVLLAVILSSIAVLNIYTSSEIEDRKKSEAQYVQGEVIVKLKAKEPPQVLFNRRYSQRYAEDEAVLKRLKVEYNLRHEKPVFQGVHKQLEARDLTQVQRREKLRTKLQKRRAAALMDTEPVDLFPIYLLQTDENVLTACERLERDPDVEYAQPNYTFELYMSPDDPYFYTYGTWGQPYDDLWGLKPGKLYCEAAWDISQGEDVIVAVIDAGVDYSHEDMAGNIWINDTEGADSINGIDDDGNGFIDDGRGWDFVNGDRDPMDDHGHGTHCAGTVAAVGNNATGIIGVAPQAKIMAVKGFSDEGQGSDYTLANCIVYAAENGAHILSNSWGGWDSSSVKEAAIDYAYNDFGCVLVFSAGNDNIDVANIYPASYSNTIAVSSTDHNDVKSDFSNWGDEIDVAAPGGESGFICVPGYCDMSAASIVSLRAEGTDMFTRDADYTPGDAFFPVQGDSNSKYYRSLGTSMACPHVSGVAALILGKNPNLNNVGVRYLLQFTADDRGDPGKDIYYGYGRVNAYNAVNVDYGIIYLADQDYIQGNVEIWGYAYFLSTEPEDLDYYVLYYAPEGSPEDTTQITLSTVPVYGEPMGSWNTVASPEGPYILTLKVFSTGGREIVHEIKVTVDNINDPPVFVNLTNKGTSVDRAVEFTVEAHDPDDPGTPWGQLWYDAYNLPPYAMFDPVTQFFGWWPTVEDKGSHTVTFVVGDNEHITEQDINILVIQTQNMLVADSLRGRGQVFPAVYGDKVVWEDGRNGNADIFMYDLASGEEIQITDDPANQGRPAIYQNKIVWTDYRNGNGDIYMYDLELKEERQITVDSSTQQMPDIYGDKIVWQDERNGTTDTDIYMYDLTGDSLRRITFDSNCQEIPAIHGNIIVWMDQRNGNMDIYMYELGYGETQITSDPEDQILPDIYENKVVYCDSRTGNYDIYMYDIYSQRESPITCDSYQQITPAIHQNNIVWVDNRNGSWDIFVYDTNTGQERLVAADVIGDYGQLYFFLMPDIHGNKIVWAGSRSGDMDIYVYDLDAGEDMRLNTDVDDQFAGGVYQNKIVWEDYRNGNADIYLCDLITGEETRITDEPAEQEAPAIDQNRIVWQDKRNGNWDIYMYDLDLEVECQITDDPAAQCEPDIHGSKIVWGDARNGAADIYLYNLEDSLEARLTTNPDYQVAPAIYQNRIVWADYRSGWPDIYMLDLDGGGEVPIADDPLYDEDMPDIYEDKIVWQDTRNGGVHDIYMYDITAAEETRITTDPNMQWLPAIHQNRIVWEDHRDGGSLYMYDLASGQEIRLTDNSAAASHPVIYGERIAWTDYRSGNADVYFMNLATGEEIQVTDELNDRKGPRISGEKIVWVDCVNGNIDICMYDLESKLETHITADSSAQYAPEIYENKIVWEDDRNGNWDIYLYDLEGEAEIQITSDSLDQSSPAVFENKIVWEDNRNGDWDIYLYDLNTCLETLVVDKINDQRFPAIWGDTIVWQDNRTGYWNIFMGDLATGEEIPITNDAGIQSSPDISGNFIVWQDNRNGDWDIYMYDLGTGQETQITTDTKNQKVPRIHESRIVWEDNRNGNRDVYMYDLPLATEVRITTSPVEQYLPDIHGDKMVWYYVADTGTDLYMTGMVYIPQIYWVYPSDVTAGETLTIEGDDFWYDQGPSEVEFANGAEGIVESWFDTLITCEVPEEAQSGTVRVITIAGPSNGYTVTVRHLPVASNLSITPQDPFATDKLTVEYDYYDSDGNPEGDSEIRWYKDDQLQSAFNDQTTVLPLATQKYEQWHFTVRPHDGYGYGELQISPVDTIVNSPPAASELYIYPPLPLTSDDLIADYRYYDDDRDPDVSNIRWYKDGLLQSGYNDSKTVPESATVVGEEWYFTVEPHDGEEAGEIKTSPSVFIRKILLPTPPELNLIKDLNP